jgi:thiamine biosynthesis protein ThiS
MDRNGNRQAAQNKRVNLDFAVFGGYARTREIDVRITLNGETHELPLPTTVDGLLTALGIDARRVAVERNLVVVRRAHYTTEVVDDGDEVEIVNFVGGG